MTPGPDLLRAQLDIILRDGTHQTIATDDTWMAGSSPITFSEIYGGEAYDARLVQKGWASPGFANSAWVHAELGAPINPDLVLNAQPDLPIHTTITLKPIALNPANKAHPAIYDMGQNMVGNIRIHLRGPRGTVVKMRFAERLNPDGGIYTANLRNADATDTYILSGEGEETYSPAFTFHGFRYVELSGVASPTLATIEGLVFNSLPAKPTVRLTSSSATLNKMNELGAWGSAATSSPSPPTARSGTSGLDGWVTPESSGAPAHSISTSTPFPTSSCSM